MCRRHLRSSTMCRRSRKPNTRDEVRELAVKAEKKEKRANKMPKKVKNKLVKKTAKPVKR